MPPEDQLRTWTRRVGDLTYTVSTDPRLIQLDAVNAAFASDMVYWAQPLAPETLRRCIEQSLCFGLYAQPTAGDDTGPFIPTQLSSSYPTPTNRQGLPNAQTYPNLT